MPKHVMPEIRKRIIELLGQEEFCLDDIRKLEAYLYAYKVTYEELRQWISMGMTSTKQL